MKLKALLTSAVTWLVNGLAFGIGYTLGSASVSAAQRREKHARREQRMAEILDDDDDH